MKTYDFFYQQISDITLICESSEKLLSHKYILSKYSDYFKYFFLFTTNTPKPMIQLPSQIKFSSLKKIHEWFYTQMIKFDSIEEAIDILSSSDFLSINLLLYKIIDYINSNIQVSNCIQILEHLATYYIKQIPLNEDYKKKLSIIYYENIDNDSNPIENCIKKIFCFLKKNFCSIVANNDIETCLKLADYLEDKEIKKVIEFSYDKIASKKELESIILFLSKLMNMTIYNLFIHVFDEGNNLLNTNLLNSPMITFSISNHKNSYDNVISQRKKIYSIRREWCISLTKSFLSDLDLDFIHFNSKTSSYIGSIAVLYKIKVIINEKNEINKNGIFVSHNKYQKKPISIFLASHQELKNENDIKVEIWFGELPLYSSLVQFFCDNFDKYLFNQYSKFNHFGVINLFHVLKMPNIDVNNEKVLLEFVLKVFKEKERIYEKDIMKCLSCIRMKSITSSDLLQVYLDDFNDPKGLSICKAYENVDNFFKKEIKRRCVNDNSNYEEYDYDKEDYNGISDHDLLLSINKPRTCYKIHKNSEEDFAEGISCWGRSNCVTEIKNFLFKNGVDIDICGENQNISQLYGKNEMSIKCLENIMKELNNCQKVIKKKENRIPLSKIKDSKKGCYLSKQTKSNKYLENKLNDIIEQIQKIRQELIEN